MHLNYEISSCYIPSHTNFLETTLPYECSKFDAVINYKESHIFLCKMNTSVASHMTRSVLFNLHFDTRSRRVETLIDII